jgi:hypothetical protein
MVFNKDAADARNGYILYGISLALLHPHWVRARGHLF